MDYEVIKKSEFFVVGIAIRTTNENNQAMKDIPALWEKFRKESIFEKITHKIDEEVIGLYTDYETDATRPYTFIAGCRVKEVTNLTSEFTAKTIPAATYAKFTTEGKFPQSLIDTWGKIWSLHVKRTYTGDFEVYGKDFGKTDHDPVEVYVAINNA